MLSLKKDGDQLPPETRATSPTMDRVRVVSPSSKSKKALAKRNDPADDDDFQTPAAKKPAAKKARTDFQTPAAKKDSGETASVSEFCDRDEDDSETDASLRQVRLRLSGSDVHRTLPHWARQLELRVPIRCSLVRRQPHVSAMTAFHQLKRWP